MSVDRSVPLEGALPRLLDVLADAKTPAYLDGAIEAATSRPQRPSWTFPGRWLPMDDDLTAPVAGPRVALRVVGVLLLAFGLLIAIGVLATGGGPSPAPSTAPASPPAAVASPPAVVPPPSASAEPSLGTTPLPDALRATWIADVDRVAGLGNHDPRLRLEVAPLGNRLWLVTNAFGNEAMQSGPIAITTDTLTVVSTQDGVGCQAGDEGSYHWSTGDGGMTFTLEALAEACSTRSEALARTWYRSLDSSSQGGRGVVGTFDPAFEVTLPVGPFSGEGYNRDAIDIHSVVLDQGLFVMKDPWGVVEPCNHRPGKSTPIEPGIDAVVAYLRTVPGAEVATEELEIDGHRALQVDLDLAGGQCGVSGDDLLTSKNVTSGAMFNVRGGQRVRFYLVELPDTTYLFDYTGPEPEVISSIRFLDSL